MEDREINVERWVAERLNAWQMPAKWQPDAARAFVAMGRLDAAMKRRRRKRLFVMAATVTACLAILLLEAPKAYCAGSGCATPAAGPKPVPAPQTIVITTPAPVAGPAPARVAAKPVPRPQPRPAPPSNFKESGAADAPITCEIYTDYQCPACAAAFQDMIPLLIADYIRTGKVRLLHRDFPLPMHAYSRLAARYANAAGQLGEYDVAVAQIFRTQAVWAETGDIDAQLTKVLPAGAMQRIRRLVNEDTTLDDTVNTDVAMGRQDGITSTPALVVVVGGRREKFPPHVSYELVTSYLDSLLKPVR